jgi:hypothetical protein
MKQCWIKYIWKILKNPPVNFSPKFLYTIVLNTHTDSVFIFLKILSSWRNVKICRFTSFALSTFCSLFIHSILSSIFFFILWTFRTFLDGLSLLCAFVSRSTDTQVLLSFICKKKQWRVCNISRRRGLIQLHFIVFRIEKYWEKCDSFRNTSTEETQVPIKYTRKDKPLEWKGYFLKFY